MKGSIHYLFTRGVTIHVFVLNRSVLGPLSGMHFELNKFVVISVHSSPVPGPSEAEGFQLEMSGLLSELVCPYTALTTGDVTQRLLNRTNCLLLLSMLTDFLQSLFEGEHHH